MRRGFRPAFVPSASDVVKRSWSACQLVPRLRRTPGSRRGGRFVVNARDARWFYREGRGAVLPFTGRWEDEKPSLDFPQVGVNLFVLAPGEPLSVYHGEDAQEDFLVLSGRCVLVVEGEERRSRRGISSTALPGQSTRSSGRGKSRASFSLSVHADPTASASLPTRRR